MLHLTKLPYWPKQPLINKPSKAVSQSYSHLTKNIQIYGNTLANSSYHKFERFESCRQTQSICDNADRTGNIRVFKDRKQCQDLWKQISQFYHTAPGRRYRYRCDNDADRPGIQRIFKGTMQKLYIERNAKFLIGIDALRSFRQLVTRLKLVLNIFLFLAINFAVLLLCLGYIYFLLCV